MTRDLVLRRDYPYSRTFTWHDGGVEYSSGAVSNIYYRKLFGPRTTNPVFYLKGSPFRNSSDYWFEIEHYDHYGRSYVEVDSQGNRLELSGVTEDIQSKWFSLYTYPADTSYLASEENQSLTECLLKLGDMKVNMGTYLAEARRSVDDLASSAKEFWQLLLDIKRGRFSRVPRDLVSGSKDLANLTLNWRYGIKPLASDLYSLSEVARSGLDHPLIMTANRSVRSYWNDSGNTQYWKERQQNVVAVNRTSICAAVSDDLLHSAQRFSLTNPVSLGWELVPFSFVVDWSLPIGNFLQALSATAGLDFVWGFRSLRRDINISARLNYGWSGDNSEQAVLVKRKSYSRYAFSGFPRPMPYVKSPFSTTHVTSALALLRQLL